MAIQGHRESRQHYYNGPRREETCLRGFANNSGADQPAHPRSLISAFVICDLESTRSKPATSEISVVSVAEETGFSLVFVGNPEDRVCRDKAPIVSPFPAVVLFDLSEF